MLGLKKSKELETIASDISIGIKYHNVLYLHECWALDEFERQPVCPVKLAEGNAGTVVIGNDDTEDDDVIGGTTSIGPI